MARSESYQRPKFEGSSSIPASGGNIKINFEVNVGNVSSEPNCVQYILALDPDDFDHIDLEEGSTLTIPAGVLYTEYNDVKLRVYKNQYTLGKKIVYRIICELYSESRDLTSNDQPGVYSVINIGIPIKVKPNTMTSEREIEFRYIDGSIKATQEGSNISLSAGENSTMTVTGELKPITTVQTNSEFIVE